MGTLKSDEDNRARAVEAFRLLMENVSDYAIFFLDTDGVVSGWNAGAERILGYNEAEIIGQPGGIIFTPEDRQKGAPEMELQKAAGAGRAEDERWHIRKDGSRFWGSGIMTGLRNEDGTLEGFAKILRDFTARQTAAEELRHAHDELETRVEERTHELRAEVAERQAAEEQIRILLRRIVFAQEDERTRISRDIHDGIGQQVTALKLKLEILWGQHQGTDVARPVEELGSLLQRLDADVSFLAWELRPAGIEHVGLKAALARYVEEWSDNFRIKAEFQSSGIEGTRLSAPVETSLYRIAQEALNNAAKYSRADGVSVIYSRRRDAVTLVIEDNGVGFDPQAVIIERGKRGLGLIGMRERAAIVGGQIEIESAPGSGTSIIVHVPVSASIPGGS